MVKLAAFIMGGRWQAVGAVVGFALLALALPPIALLSGAALALVTLRLGASRGLGVLGLAVLALAALSAIATGQAWLGAAYGIVQWTPLLLLALALRASLSLALTLQCAAAAGLVAVLALTYLAPGIDGIWSELLNALVRPALVSAKMPAGTIDAVLQQAVPVMTGSFIAALLLSIVLALLIARWWQALLYNPGGFRDEFTGLQLGYSAAGLALALIAGALLTQATLILELAMVASVIFFLQGMAVIHAVIAKTGHPGMWLTGVYGLLLLALPQMMAGLSLVGALDAFANFRGRLAPSGRGEP